MSTAQVQDCVMHPRVLGDGDSGFHEFIDDASTFELFQSVLQSSQLLPVAEHHHHLYHSRAGECSDGSRSFSEVSSPCSPVAPTEARLILSVSSTDSVATQPDLGLVDADGEGEAEGEVKQETEIVTFMSPSPVGSEEDISGKESDDAFEDAGHSSPEEDELGEQWNPDFYTLQSRAPKPILVPCLTEMENKPTHYGKEYHGVLSREDATDVLGSGDGHYLVREGQDGEFILSFMLAGRMWNFKLFYENNMHFVGEKMFEDVEDLVQDGLITIFLSQHNVMQAMENGRQSTRKHSQKLRRKPCGRVKGLKGKSKSAYLERLRLDSSPIMPKSFPEELRRMPMTPNSNGQQSDLDLTTTSERRGYSTTVMPHATSTPKSMERRTKSTESLLKSVSETRGRYSSVLALRDAVRADKNRDLKAEKESLSQSVDISILSEKAASILGIAPPKQFKRASMYDPLLEEQRVKTQPPTRSFSYHPNVKKIRAFEKVTSLPRDLHKRAAAAVKKTPAYSYYKAHKFKPVTYTHPTWCVICHHFLWGLKMQGLRCQDCGIDIHRQCCAGSLDHECNPTKKVVKRVFGVDLTTLLKVEENKLPSVLQQCVKHIESFDLKEEGLYRVSGQTSEILDFKEKFDNGEKVDFSNCTDINVVTGLVKLYLRELPIPVVTFDAYNEVMKATSCISEPGDPDANWAPLTNALKLLPKAHYNVLKYLVEHLHRVDQNSSHNKMTAYNLAAVFSPTLMRAPSEDLSLVKDLPLQRHFVEMLILKHDILFDL